MPDQIVDQLHADITRLRTATIVLYLFVIALLIVGGLYAYFELAAQARTLNTALCNQRHDQQQRITSSKAFLKAHPKGAFGFTRAQIQDSIDRAEKNAHSLAGLDC